MTNDAQAEAVNGANWVAHERRFRASFWMATVATATSIVVWMTSIAHWVTLTFPNLVWDSEQEGFVDGGAVVFKATGSGLLYKTAEYNGQRFDGEIVPTWFGLVPSSIGYLLLAVGIIFLALKTHSRVVGAMASVPAIFALVDFRSIRSNLADALIGNNTWENVNLEYGTACNVWILTGVMVSIGIILFALTAPAVLRKAWITAVEYEVALKDCAPRRLLFGKMADDVKVRLARKAGNAIKLVSSYAQADVATK